LAKSGLYFSHYPFCLLTYSENPHTTPVKRTSLLNTRVLLGLLEKKFFENTERKEKGRLTKRERKGPSFERKSSLRF